MVQLLPLKVTKAQANHYQAAIAITGHNLLFQIDFAEDQQNDEIHKTILKIDIAGQLVKTIRTIKL